ncbi:MAG: SelT/SelW/SelH family protein [Opitutales bacterium]|nr:SelT/SelW/SelH family protein [Opitutales bacterium]
MNQNRIRIEYCTGCRWLLRSAWTAQELLTTFQNELFEVSLQPKIEQAGHFQVHCNGTLIWCRKKEEGFPEMKEIKQRIRDLVDPKKDLGHSEKK